MDIHTLVSNILFPALLVFAGFVTYWFWLRPLLAANPAFKHVYAAEDTVINAVSAKFRNVKQRVTTIVVSFIGIVLVAHDAITELMTAAGFDPVAYGQQVLPKVPTYVWPLVTIAVVWLIQHFRNTADRFARANAETLLNAGHTLTAPAPGIPVNTLPSPAPFVTGAQFPDKIGG